MPVEVLRDADGGARIGLPGLSERDQGRVEDHEAGVDVVRALQAQIGQADGERHVQHSAHALAVSGPRSVTLSSSVAYWS